MLLRSFVLTFLFFSTLLLAQDQPKPGVYIQPYPVCHDIEQDGQNLQLCVNASIAAATLEGRSFAEDSQCSVVRTQRPFRPKVASKQGQPDDPRLQDPVFMRELNWVKSQVRAGACTCCHDTSTAQDYAAWDMNAPYVWIEQMTDRALAIMEGSVSTRLMGRYPKALNFGFDRSETGPPTTDVPRMKAFFRRELDRRGVTAESIAKMPSGDAAFEPVLQQQPQTCPDTVGIDADGTVNWGDTPARYVYLTTPETINPLGPPAADLPVGTIWRLDVLASNDPLASGVSYGSVPPGTRQRFPLKQIPPALEKGRSYRLYVTRDVMRPLVNCIFVAEASTKAR